MSHDRTDPRKPPVPEQFAAYVDGELGTEERSAIETWLAHHPDALTEVTALRRLAELMRQSAAAEPAGEAWNGVHRQVEAALAAVRRRPAQSFLRVALGLAPAAARLGF